MSRFNCVRFIKDSLDFDWFEVDDWDKVEIEIRNNFLDSCGIDFSREDEVVIEWGSKGGKVYIEDEEEWEFECGYGNIV